MHALLKSSLVAVAGCLLLAGCGKEPPKTIARAPIAVQTVTMKPAAESLWIETLGLTEGMQQAEVRAQVSGILEKINYREGDRVKAGDSLFQIDPAPYRAALDQASGTVREVKARLSSRSSSARPSATRNSGRPVRQVKRSTTTRQAPSRSPADSSQRPKRPSATPASSLSARASMPLATAS